MQNKIRIQLLDIAQVDTDCVVNAANEGLRAGGGVCGAIFRAAGHDELQEACDRIGHCRTGSAVITNGFRLKAKYIIHAVGPIWSGGNRGEKEKLQSAYEESIKLALEHGCKSIAFPPISSGIFGYPKEKAWKDAVEICRKYEDKIDIVFTVNDDKAYKIGKAIIEG